MTYRCRTCGRDNRLPNQCGCEPRNAVGVYECSRCREMKPLGEIHRCVPNYLGDRGTDRVLAAIDRHEDASERVRVTIDDIERIEREHQKILRDAQAQIRAALEAISDAWQLPVLGMDPE